MCKRVGGRELLGEHRIDGAIEKGARRRVEPTLVRRLRGVSSRSKGVSVDVPKVARVLVETRDKAGGIHIWEEWGV